ncbi:MAG TPA: histidine phosphatase family protein [Actinomycetota bacterium]|jgi:broad specificity phosphatase PhoE
MRTLVHLVRHAEVENPGNTWYGRLDGYVLSERGLRQAKALGEYFAGRGLSGVYSSPLTRAVQTAEAIAQATGLEVEVDPNLIETITHLEGGPADWRIFRKLRNIRYFVNPLRPSWGEPYPQVRRRMLAAIDRIRQEHPGAESVAVSHMSPILIARLMIEGIRRPPWATGTPCARASVTTLEFEGERYARTEYVEVGSSVA